MNESSNKIDEVTVRDLVIVFRVGIQHLKKYKGVLILLSVVGLALGLTYCIMKKEKYEATTSLILSENNNTLFGVSNAASALGFGSEQTGLFDANDNIIWLYQSNRMIKDALLAKNINAKDSSLLKWCVRIYHIDLNGANINALDTCTKLKPSQNEIIQKCILNIKYSLQVDVQKNAKSIIYLSFKSTDELFSKLFMENLVKTVNEYYIKTKTEKLNYIVSILENKAKESRILLNTSISQSANFQENIPYANPNLQTLEAPIQKKSVDVQTQIVLYTEIMKNLEIKKLELAQATPRLEVIDSPQLPLYKIKPSKIWIVIGALILPLIGSIIILISSWFKKSMQSDN